MVSFIGGDETQAEEENITRYLMEIFWEIVHGIGEVLKIDCMELFEEMIRDNERAEEIMRLFSPVFKKNQLHNMSTPLQYVV